MIGMLMWMDFVKNLLSDNVSNMKLVWIIRNV